MAYDPKDQAALALKTLLEAQITLAPISEEDATQNVVTTKESTDKSAPLVIVSITSGTEEPLDTGNYWLDVEVEVRSIGVVDSDGVDPKEENVSLVDEVVLVLKADDLPEQLTGALENFHCFGVSDWRPMFEDQGDAFVDKFAFKIYCCASDLA